MNTTTTTKSRELNYYELRLKAYLNDYFPERLSDHAFIHARSERAGEAYETAFLQGNNPHEAHAIAMEVLFEGLHFSPYYVIEQILENEFETEVPAEQVRTYALLLLRHPNIQQTIAKYHPDDTFDGTPEYDLLYTELCGVIAMIMEASLIDR